MIIPPTGHADLPRHIGVGAATMLVVGNVIGSGIFLTSGLMLEDVGSGGGLLLAWICGGIVAAVGCLVIAELATAFPRSGGLFVFLQEAFGDRLAFLYGWTCLLVLLTGQVAGIAIAFAGFTAEFAPALHNKLGNLAGFPVTGTQLLAVISILACAIVNISLDLGRRVASGLNLLKVVALLLLPAAAILMAQAAPQIGVAPAGMPATFLLGGLGAAMIPALYAYEGWHHSVFAASEVQNPERMLPISLFAGIGLVVAIYLAINLAYLSAAPIEVLAGEQQIAVVAAEHLLPGYGGRLIAALGILSTLGCNAALTLVAARLFLTMSRAGLFFGWAGRLSNRTKAPVYAIWVTAAWAILCTLTGTYSELLAFVVFAATLFSGASGLALLRLRRTRPELPRPFKVPLYPLTPLLFSGMMAVLAVITLLERPTEAGIGLLLILTGLPAYQIFLTRKAAVA